MPKKDEQVTTRLTQEETRLLEKIAKELGVTPHFLRRFALRQIIKDYKKGRKPTVEDLWANYKNED